MHESLHSYVEELLHAARSGFDGVGGQRAQPVHLRHLAQPEPGRRRSSRTRRRSRGSTPRSRVLGRSLGKSREPLKIAEEYAVLDILSGGRLIAGLPVGLSYDANQNGGIPPIETRARYREGRALLEKAWSATEPFAWNGKYSRYPIGQHLAAPAAAAAPAVLGPGQRHAGHARRDPRARGRLHVPQLVRRDADRRAHLRPLLGAWPTRQGRDRNPYRARVPADRLRRRHRRGGRAPLRRSRAAPLPQRARRDPAAGVRAARLRRLRGVEAIMRDPGDLGLAPKLPTITFRELADTRAVIVGGAETVREQITEFVKECRIGNLLVMLHVRLDAARARAPQHRPVRLGGAAAPARDLGGRGVGAPLVAHRNRQRAPAGALAGV